ncbi:uncharacterized protein LOC129194042 isoform X1 [Dunckerocampus dactyliophorus]|uniref:uncharacterized protein LOC129194042 isoform X1 n=1 Tax=Dunckerocampus dactyliophorus TaxID=161453 RepID=UPI002406CE8B|nr:uncharacterized protein LOC129194042 isoform X1 [Dunckerocampus dactyliophorus]
MRHQVQTIADHTDSAKEATRRTTVRFCDNAEACVAMEDWSSLNFIPSGRQLPRTPSLIQVKQELDFCSEAPASDPPLTPQEMTEGASGEQLDSKVSRTDANSGGADYSDPLLNGMKGYQLTPNDLDFIRTLKEDKQSKLLEEQLKALKREVTSETMALELALASREKARADLEKVSRGCLLSFQVTLHLQSHSDSGTFQVKHAVINTLIRVLSCFMINAACQFPTCSELAELLKLVLRVASPVAQVSELDARSLLAMVTTGDVHVALSEKREAVSQLEKMVASQRKKDDKERRRQEKQLASNQLLIQRLISDVSELTSQLAQRDELKDGGGGASEDVQAAESHVKHPEKAKRKIVAPKTSQPISRKPADEDKSSSKSKNISLKSTVEKTTKASTGQQMLEDEPELVEGTRGRRKPAGASQVKSGRAAKNSKLAEEEPSLVLRRSKRIASRR